MFGDLSIAGAKVLLALATVIAPPPEMKISAWVDQGHVIVSEKTNSPRPGPVSFDGVEYCREILDKLHPDDPCSRVSVRGSAQSAKSLIGQLWVAWSVANNPKSFAIGLPTAGEAVKYSDFKLQPILEDSPSLRHRVRPASTKGTDGSKTQKKKLFNGASILIFNLSSPAELQMISTGNLILEEVANALKTVGSRGAPIKQARERQAAYSVVGSKELMVSTPGILGDCEITKAEEAGDRRRLYGPCQAAECGVYFPLEPEGFMPADKSWGHHFVCPGCGGPLFERHMKAWRPAAVWLASFTAEDPEANPAPPPFIAAADMPGWQARRGDRPALHEGREPSYYVWQVFCGLISWDHYAAAKDGAVTPSDLITFEQQNNGRAYDPSIEAMSWEELHRLREDYEHGTVPADAGLLTGFADVQGGYFQWAVYAWGPGGEWWVVDRGVIEGDTAGDQVWQGLDAVSRRTYPHAAGGQLAIESFGVDTGFRTQKVYSFCRGRPNCYAMDGRPGWKIPIFGKPKAVKVVEDGRVRGRTKLYPTGTWELKSLLHWSLKLSVEAGYQTRLQGRGHWSKTEDEAWAQQITAEALSEEQDVKTRDIKRWWQVINGRRNEETDIWVGARALAWMHGVGAPARDGRAEGIDWARRALDRNPAAPQSDLFKASAARRPAAAPPGDPETPAPAKRRFFRSRT